MNIPKIEGIHFDNPENFISLLDSISFEYVGNEKIQPFNIFVNNKSYPMKLAASIHKLRNNRIIRSNKIEIKGDPSNILPFFDCKKIIITKKDIKTCEEIAKEIHLYPFQKAINFYSNFHKNFDILDEIIYIEKKILNLNDASRIEEIADKIFESPNIINDMNLLANILIKFCDIRPNQIKIYFKLIDHIRNRISDDLCADFLDRIQKITFNTQYFEQNYFLYHFLHENAFLKDSYFINVVDIYDYFSYRQNTLFLYLAKEFNNNFYEFNESFSNDSITSYQFDLLEEMEANNWKLYDEYIKNMNEDPFRFCIRNDDAEMLQNLVNTYFCNNFFFFNTQNFINDINFNNQTNIINFHKVGNLNNANLDGYNEIEKLNNNVLFDLKKLRLNSKITFDYKTTFNIKQYDTLIEFSAALGSIKCFKYLFVNGDKKCSLPKGLLEAAFIGGNVEIIRICLQNGFSINCNNKKKILHCAAINHHYRLFDWLNDEVSFYELRSIFPNSLSQELKYLNFLDLKKYLIMNKKIDFSFVKDACHYGNHIITRIFLPFLTDEEKFSLIYESLNYSWNEDLSIEILESINIDKNNMQYKERFINDNISDEDTNSDEYSSDFEYEDINNLNSFNSKNDKEKNIKKLCLEKDRLDFLNHIYKLQPLFAFDIRDFKLALSHNSLKCAEFLYSRFPEFKDSSIIDSNIIHIDRPDTINFVFSYVYKGPNLVDVNFDFFVSEVANSSLCEQIFELESIQSKLSSNQIMNMIKNQIKSRNLLKSLKIKKIRFLFSMLLNLVKKKPNENFNVNMLTLDAFLSNDKEIVNMVTKNDQFDINFPVSNTQSTILHFAISNINKISNPKIIFSQIFLLSNKININLQDINGDTPLMLSIKHNLRDIFDYIFDNYAPNVNLQNKIGQTSLMISAIYKNEYMFSRLSYDEKADIEIEDFIGMNCMFYAVKNDMFRCIESILRNNKMKQKYINYRSKLKISLLSCSNSIQMFNWLKKNGAKTINCYDEKGDTLLISSIKKSSNIKLNQRWIIPAELLKEKELNINKKNRIGKTALMIAIECNDISTISMITKNQAVDLSIQSYSGETALSIAIKVRNIELVKYLMIKLSKYDEKSLIESIGQTFDLTLPAVILQNLFKTKTKLSLSTIINILPQIKHSIVNEIFNENPKFKINSIYEEKTILMTTIIFENYFIFNRLISFNSSTDMKNNFPIKNNKLYNIPSSQNYNDIANHSLIMKNQQQLNNLKKIVEIINWKNSLGLSAIKIAKKYKRISMLNAMEDILRIYLKFNYLYTD